MSATLKSLEPGDRCYLVPERRTGGQTPTEMVVVLVGRSYIYVKPATASKYTLERAYLIANGAPKVCNGRIERLVVDIDSWEELTATKRCFAALRKSIPYEPATGVTMADIRAAADLLKVSLP